MCVAAQMERSCELLNCARSTLKRPSGSWMGQRTRLSDGAMEPRRAAASPPPPPPLWIVWDWESPPASSCETPPASTGASTPPS